MEENHTLKHIEYVVWRSGSVIAAVMSFKLIIVFRCLSVFVSRNFVFDDQEEMQYVLDALQASDAETCNFFLFVIESIIERRVLQSGTIEEYYYDN